MDDPSSVVPAPEPPPRPVREDRAVIVFLILAVTSAIALLAGLVGSSDLSMLERLVRLAPTAVGAIALFVAAGGLAARQSWAVGSLTILLWLLIVEGLVGMLAAAGEGRLFIPIAPLLGVWVLRAPPSAITVSTRSPGALATISVFVLAAAGPWLADAVLAPGGPLIAGSTDLVPQLRIDCGQPDGGVPETLAASFDWSWRRTEALADSTDMVAVGWTGQDDAGTDLYILGDTPGLTSSPGIWQGGGSPSSDLADRFASRFRPFNSWTWGVTLGEQRMQPGHIPFTLRRVASEPIAHGQLVVQAAYVHLGRWINKEPTVTCTW